MKTEITDKQKHQFNLMRATLRRICKDYSTPAQLRRNSEKDYGLGFEEVIEMAYENIQQDAAYAVKGVKEL